VTTSAATEWTQDDLLGVLERAPEAWRTKGERYLSQLAATGVPFTADDLRDAGLDEPGDGAGNAWGALFNWGARRGLIVWTGSMVPARKGTRHGNLNRVWIGVQKW